MKTSIYDQVEFIERRIIRNDRKRFHMPYPEFRKPQLDLNMAGKPQYQKEADIELFYQIFLQTKENEDFFKIYIDLECYRVKFDTLVPNTCDLIPSNLDLDT